MSNIKVNVDGMYDAMIEILNTYKREGGAAIDEACEEEAEEVRKRIRHNVGTAGIKGRHYKGGWQIKRSRSAMHLSQYVIFNGSKPGLAHLLEKGHANPRTKNPDKLKNTPAYPHIAEATENMDEELFDKIGKKLGW